MSPSATVLNGRYRSYSASACCVAALYIALLCAATLRFVTAPSIAEPRALAGWGTLLALAAMVSFGATSRYYRSKVRRGLRLTPSRYSREFLALAEAGMDAIVVLEAVRDDAGAIADFGFRFLNSRAALLLGVEDTQVLGKNVREAMPFFATEHLLRQFRSVVDTGDSRTGEFAVNDTRVNAKWLRLATSRFEDGVLLSVTDLTAQKQMEVQLCHRAYKDALTGLPNRLLLDDRLQQAIERAKRNRQAAAVMMLDIDSLKRINEQYGPKAGDHVLKSVASRLRAAVRSTDSVFRLGGDEFVILFTDIASSGPMTDFARKVVLSLFAPVPWQGKDLDVSASLGVAMFPDAGSTPETLLIQADIEMQRMKQSHGAPKTVSMPLMAPMTYGDFKHLSLGMR